MHGSMLHAGVVSMLVPDYPWWCPLVAKPHTVITPVTLSPSGAT